MWSRETRDDIAREYRFAVLWAMKYRGAPREEAMDFAGWLAVLWLRKKSLNQPFMAAWVDYLRQKHGRTDKHIPRRQLHKEVHPSEFFWDSVATDPGPLPDDLMCQKEAYAAVLSRIPARFWKKPKYLAVLEGLAEGKLQEEIALEMDITPSRVCQMIHEIRKASKKPGGDLK